MDELQTLEAMGFTLPSPAYIFGMILFSLIGFVAYRYGKTTANQHVKWLGVVMMLYTYVVPGTILMYVVGVGLCAACYYYRNHRN